MGGLFCMIWLEITVHIHSWRFMFDFFITFEYFWLLICCFLTFCSLRSNQISDKGARTVAAALQVNQSLQKLKSHTHTHTHTQVQHYAELLVSEARGTPQLQRPHPTVPGDRHHLRGQSTSLHTPSSPQALPPTYTHNIPVHGPSHPHIFTHTPSTGPPITHHL